MPVYAYTYEQATTNQADHAYGINKMDPQGGGTMILMNINQHHLHEIPGAGNGAPEKRSGTIAVEVVRQQADGGLVLRVSEPPAQTAPAECVTFSNTAVVCDPNAAFGPEVQDIVSMLGRGFVDPARIDADKHWQLTLDGTVESTADYRIVDSRGTLLQIEENGTRSPKGARERAQVSARIDYDATRSLPTDVEEAIVLHVQHGSVYQTTETYATFLLLPVDALLQR